MIKLITDLEVEPNLFIKLYDNNNAKLGISIGQFHKGADMFVLSEEMERKLLQVHLDRNTGNQIEIPLF